MTTGSSERDLFANKYAVKDRKPADAKSPDFQDLELDKNGQYAALVLSSRVGLNGMCISEDTAGESAPCWLSERGQWSISAGDGATTLKLSPTAQPSRSYTAALEGDTFKLTRQGRVTELLKR